MLHYQEGVALLKDGPELDGGEGPPHYQVRGAAVQPAEDVRADAGNEDDPELLQAGLPFRARASISSGAISTLERLGEQGDGWQEFDSHDWSGGASEWRGFEGYQEAERAERR
jgi:hypothetical protein